MSDIFDKPQCWENKELHQRMLLAANGKLWPTLENADHWPVLKHLIIKAHTICDKSGLPNTLLDIGCGPASLSEHLEGLSYAGTDLGHVIENVAKVRNPNQKYYHCNILEDDLGFMENYSICVANAFVSVMENPLAVLENLLLNAGTFLILHRQRLGYQTWQQKLKAPEYGGWRWESTIGYEDLEKMCNKNGFHPILTLSAIPDPLHGDYYSILFYNGKNKDSNVVSNIKFYAR